MSNLEPSLKPASLFRKPILGGNIAQRGPNGSEPGDLSVRGEIANCCTSVPPGPLSCQLRTGCRVELTSPGAESGGDATRHIVLFRSKLQPLPVQSITYGMSAPGCVNHKLHVCTLAVHTRGGSGLKNNPSDISETALKTQ